MAKVIVDINVSLDGFVAGPNDSPTNPAGDGGDKLFNWMFGEAVTADNQAIMDKLRSNTGAVVAGRRTYDMVNGWGGNIDVPHYILSHDSPKDIPGHAELFHFLDDARDAIEQAKQAAADNIAHVLGGANAIQQALQTGLVDEMQLHIVPVLLGSGVRLFENMTTLPQLEKVNVVDTPAVTHLTYKVN